MAKTRPQSMLEAQNSRYPIKRERTPSLKAREIAAAIAARQTPMATRVTTKKADKKKTPAQTMAPVTAKKVASSTSKKRKADVEAVEPVAKKSKPAPKPKAAPKPKVAAKPKVTPKPVVIKPKVPKSRRKGLVKNTVPTQILDVYVFGEGTAGELGLGSKRYDGKKKPIDVKRPRLNTLLDAKTVGVVQVALGGMHCVALTQDNKILTWGVNDQKALGRSTAWDGGLEDADANSDSDSDDEDDFDDQAMNPFESTPTAISLENVAEGSVFVQVFATDNATFVLTQDGHVYGCGTFRGNEGQFMFTEHAKIEETLVWIEGLEGIVKLDGGSNHMIALDHKGNTMAWGTGEQSQLGRRIVERHRANGCTPREFGLPRGKIVDIGSGDYFSFAVDKTGEVYSWGLNSFGQTGHPVDEDEDGEENKGKKKPTKGDEKKDKSNGITAAPVPSLEGHKIKEICGGAHHTLAATEDGKLLAWGRCNGHQCFINMDDFPHDAFIWGKPPSQKVYARDAAGEILKDENGFPLWANSDGGEEVRKALKEPVVVPGITVKDIAAAGDTSMVLTTDGKVLTCGFSGNYQTGTGQTEDVEVPTLVTNSAIADADLVGVALGGQFGMLFGAHKF